MSNSAMTILHDYVGYLGNHRMWGRSKRSVPVRNVVALRGTHSRLLVTGVRPCTVLEVCHGRQKDLLSLNGMRCVTYEMFDCCYLGWQIIPKAKAASLDTYLYVDDADISTALHISFFSSRKASPTISADTIAHSHNTCGGDGGGQRR